MTADLPDFRRKLQVVTRTGVTAAQRVLMCTSKVRVVSAPPMGESLGQGGLIAVLGFTSANSFIAAHIVQNNGVLIVLYSVIQ